MKFRNFLKNFADTVANATPAEVGYDKIDIWFQDEARIGQRGTRSRIWAITGTRPRAVRQQQFLSTYIYGAICPQTGASAGLILPESNTECMNLHLEEISKKVPVGRHAVIVMDQAGWHTTESLAKFNNITPVFLPPNSPELNPVEQVWQWIRSHKLSDRCFDNYDDILNSAAEAWMHFADKIGIDKSIGCRSWTNLGI
jgi:transposase